MQSFLQFLRPKEFACWWEPPRTLRCNLDIEPCSACKSRNLAALLSMQFYGVYMSGMLRQYVVCKAC